jgi:peptide deformylase
MSLLEILRWPDPRLAQVCAPVGAVTPEIERLAADMLETMYAAPGRGLAGPQVGVLRRIFVMDVTWKEGAPDPLVVLDPEVEPLGEELIARDEGCLSIPGVMAEVTRPARVRMRWTGLDGVRRERDFDGFGATCVQHETDHLNGIVTFDRLDPDARAALIADYDAQ